MGFDRREITVLEPVNPEPPRVHASELAAYSPAADGMDFAREGFHTISRADPNSFVYGNNRPLTTLPVREGPNVTFDERAPARVKY